MASFRIYAFVFISLIFSHVYIIRANDDFVDILEPLGMGSLDDDEPEPGPDLSTVAYTKPNTDSMIMAELFDEDWANRWVISEDSKFTGGWIHSLRDKEAITGDYGIKTEHESRHHAISAKIDNIDTLDTSEPFILQYEAKFQDDLICGGAYIKLFDSSSSDLKFFSNQTPYVIMFGPDRCGATNKVHFILKVKNPINKEWEEHHATTPPTVPSGTLTHLYTLIIRADNTFDILVDNVVRTQGNLFKDMTPPINPPKMIDDPEDTKPSDWVDKKQIPDPEAAKPDDWDEDAPKRIADPEASKPNDWLDDKEPRIRDPNASQPDDWDDEEDGEWEAPLIANPACENVSGCGKWEAPMINNPEYKGKWRAPMIDNPEYKGEWKPRQVENPNYYEINEPHKLAKFDAVGFELWVIQKDLLFDNIIITNNENARVRFTDETFEIRKSIEEKQHKASSADEDKLPSNEGVLGLITTIANQHPILISVGLGLFILLLLSSNRCFRKSSIEIAADGETKTVKASKGSKDKDSEQEEDSDEEKETESTDGNEKKKKRASKEKEKSSNKCSGSESEAVRERNKSSAKNTQEE